MTSDTVKTEKRRRIRYVIAACLVLIPLLSYLETLVFQIKEISLPFSGNVLVFGLININVLLLLLMVFLVLRNLVELIFDRRRKIVGTKLRTRLVISFISLSLIPTVLLFFIALQFVSTSMDYWFNSNVDKSLQESLNIAKDIYQQTKLNTERQGNIIAGKLSLLPLTSRAEQELSEACGILLAEQQLDTIELISDQRQPIIHILSDLLSDTTLPPPPPEVLRKALDGELSQHIIQSINKGDVVRHVVPVTLSSSSNPAVLLCGKLIPASQLQRMNIISEGIEGYRQLMLFKAPIKTSLLIMLLIVTLLIIFSAIWFGIYIAQGLTGPIAKLAEATRRVAEGNLDFELQRESDDEMGLLVDSFNRMTRDVRSSKEEIEKANLALQASYNEIDARRQYTETILQNVAAGVISLDQDGRITTINHFAENLLQINKDDFLGKDYRTTLPPSYRKIMDGFLSELERSSKPVIQHPLKLSVRKQTFSLLVNFTRLENDQGEQLGVVMVFDNLTQLEKAQRVAAWREVARRIAHEVKNPLTPIQLSAQRLRKRYLDTLGDDGEILNQCTRTIVNQVDELKQLVSEFSSFARMPVVKPTLGNLQEMLQDVLVLYQESHPEIRFNLSADESVTKVYFDRKQIKRVMINLLENGIAVLPDGGEININVSPDDENKNILIRVEDNGPGVKDDDKLRLFEPYFSTKKSGTGLGLAIANAIIADHGGSIRVEDNIPNGTVFIIELPLIS
jgi:two-component system nitrogen regulation sensor histidine kinase NtrY